MNKEKTVHAWGLALRVKGKYVLNVREMYVLKTHAHLRAIQIGEPKYEVIKVKIIHNLEP